MSNAVKTCKLDWTKDDLILLIAEYPYKGPNISKLREKFNRRQIWYKAYTLGVHKKSGLRENENGNKWCQFTEEDISLLERFYPDQGSNIPELLLRHTPHSIRHKANLLGIHRVYRFPNM